MMGGAWVDQSVKHPTLDFSSGHDLTICKFEPRHQLCTDSMEPVWYFVSFSLCPSPACSLSLSKYIKINSKKKKKKRRRKSVEGRIHSVKSWASERRSKRTLKMFPFIRSLVKYVLSTCYGLRPELGKQFWKKLLWVPLLNLYSSGKTVKKQE